MTFVIVTHALAFLVGATIGLAIDDVISLQSTSADIAEKALFAGAGGVVTYGFKFFNDSQKRRRERLERRVESIEALIRTYASTGVSYWIRELSDSDGRVMESEIKGLRKRIAAEVSTLKSAGYDCGKECRQDLIELYQAVTDGDFEGQGRTQVQVRREERISEAANSAVVRMRGAFKII